VLIAYRNNGYDWQFTNVTGGQTHMLIDANSPGWEEQGPIDPMTFEMRVTNWALGVQIDAIHVGAGRRLIELPKAPRRIEFIGDSLAAGMYNSYEGLSGFA